MTGPRSDFILGGMIVDATQVSLHSLQLHRRPRPATLTLNCLFILDGECAPVTLNVTMRMSWNLFLDPLQYPQMAFLCAAHNRDSSRGFWQDFS